MKRKNSNKISKIVIKSKGKTTKEEMNIKNYKTTSKQL